MNNITIKPVQIEHLSTLSEIYVRSYNAHKAEGVNEDWTLDRAQLLLEFYFRIQPDLAFVAVMDDKIVGAFFIPAKPWWDGYLLFDGELFVAPEFQRLGVASDLFLHGLTEAKRKYSASYIDTVTFKNIAFPLSWYRKIGLKENTELVLISGSVDEIIDNLSKSS